MLISANYRGSRPGKPVGWYRDVLGMAPQDARGNQEMYDVVVPQFS